MKVLIIVAATILAGGCATVTFNGQDLARMGTTTAIVAIATALILADDEDDPVDKHSRCPSCPPATPID